MHAYRVCVYGETVHAAVNVKVRGKHGPVGSLLLPLWVIGLAARAFTQRATSPDSHLVWHPKFLCWKPNLSLPQ